jgi:predicted chitinase
MRSVGGRGGEPSRGEVATPGKRTLTEALVQQRPGGGAVPADLRARAEPVLGADLSGVKLHAGAESATAAASVGARAYTVGQDVHFGAGEYRPGSEAGDRLIAHELAHTVQQGDVGGAPQFKLGVSQPGDAPEVEADHLADAIVTGGGGARGVTQRTAPQIARFPTDPMDTTGKDGEPQGAATRPPGAVDPADQVHMPLDGGGWSPAYGANANEPGQGPHSHVGETIRDYKATIEDGKDGWKERPDLKAASSRGGTKAGRFEMTVEDLYAIYRSDPLLAAELLGTIDDIKKQYPERDPDGELKKYLGSVSEAFRIMMIDTVEAQALYLAHAAGETALAKLSESQFKSKSFEDDPTSLPTGQLVDTTALATQYPTGGQMRNTIDPRKDQWDFIGRGPIQVTHQGNYVQALAYLEERWTQLQLEHNTGDADTVERAIKAIKADPRAAASPEFAFLFSAAFMHMSGGVVSSAEVAANPKDPGFVGDDAASRWVAGGDFNINTNANKTQAAYDTAVAGGDPAAIAAAKQTRDEWQGHKHRAEVKAAMYKATRDFLLARQRAAATPGAPPPKP